MSFGKRLAELRTNQKLSQSQLAEILIISKSALGMYEIKNVNQIFTL
ncbi:helix-turn-helix domain-containing protein [Paenibacillus illinoisensis]